LVTAFESKRKRDSGSIRSDIKEEKSEIDDGVAKLICSKTRRCLFEEQQAGVS
jgi:hypothetical protein